MHEWKKKKKNPSQKAQYQYLMFMFFYREREGMESTRLDVNYKEKDFPFPFQPYDIQNGLMQSLWECCDGEKFGIMESPTGTGKTQSIINGSLTWLRDFKKREDVQDDDSSEEHDPNIPDWVVEANRQQKRQNRESEIRMSAIKRTKIEKRLKRPHITISTDDEDLLQDPVDETQNSFNEYECDSDTSSESAEPENTPKIIFASRTHTQISQFISELKKTIWWKDPSIRALQLASRSHLCINKDVINRSRGNPERLNDLCNTVGADAQNSQCPYTGKGSGLKKLMDRMKVTPMEIEDILKHGKHDKGCPYFATKRTVDRANVIALPYSTLLSQASRLAYGLHLEGNVIVVDEGHNITESVNQTHSVTATLPMLQQTQQAVSLYLNTYKNRLHVKNKTRVRKLSAILKKLVDWVVAKSQTNKNDNQESELLNMTQLVFTSDIEGVDVPEIIRFLREVHLFRKLQGFLEKRNEASVSGGPPLATVASMYNVEKFLFMIVAANREHCRLIYSTTNGHPTLAIISVFAADEFRVILDKARSVVLAGGTMSPVSDIKHQLIPQLKEDKIIIYQCGHVIPPDNIIPITVAAGYGECFDFRFENRANPSLLMSLSRVLVDLCSVVPQGLVVFFSSYAYEQFFWDYITKKPAYEEIRMKKKVYREPKQANDVGAVLTEYQNDCLNKGALLSCVIGGKLSEGINFSDGYGRCVIIVGMPYPNKSDPILAEKQNVLRCHAGAAAATSMFDVMCMKAVNQSIGRAIRHQNDFASILLLDHRYSHDRIKQLLPSWVLRSTRDSKDFGECKNMIQNFFDNKKDKL